MARTAREVETESGFDFKRIEAKWQARWQEQHLYEVDLPGAARPYYNLMMFPYPSAEGLHVGNMYAFIGSDVYGRYQAMHGLDVFEPMGFDAFGIHSENFAIKMGAHPRPMTAANTARFKKQLERIGNRFDWSAEVHSTDPDYYRWTQWIFVKLFKAGLVEHKSAAVNWCPKDKTVLADEQVIGGRCERCGSIVQKRQLKQWFLRITAYAEQLLDNLDWLDWSERVIALQRNWIGRSEGLEFEIEISTGRRGRKRASAPETVRVRLFTTRPDTIYGATFVVLAPDHPAVEHIVTGDRREAVASYVARVQDGGEVAARPETGVEAEITGVFTGAYAVHPLTGEHMPVYVADYVLAAVGTGAIMGVPAHDARDYVLAAAMDLPVQPVVMPETAQASSRVPTLPYTGAGVLVDSGEWTGVESTAAAALITAWFESRGSGRRAVRYHLRDWLISRQRYWGPPIPIIYCPEHGAVPVPEEQLPVVLPELEQYQPDGSGVSPLARVEAFVQTACPVCGGPARRETDVSDNFLDSAWYFLRYPSKGDQEEPWSPELTRKWLPVDMYVGGAEHSVLHLLYSRFITMALHDLGYLDFAEPFKRFRANGRITRDGGKMSKSKGNVVSPDAYLDRYGADAFRTYLLFMGTYEAGGDFSDRGLGGVTRFLDRTWRYTTNALHGAVERRPEGEAYREMHQTIQRVTADIAELKYNTAIAALMKYLNYLQRRPAATRSELRTLVQLLAPFAPYITEELWQVLGEPGSVHTSSWPEVDEKGLQAPTMVIVVEVNSRVRGHIEVPADLPAVEIQRRAMAVPSVARATSDLVVEKVVYVPGRLVNIVVLPRGGVAPDRSSTDLSPWGAATAD
ncbi:MAG: leucine--tRNA ligase [Chloroflexi bacterium]|nr:MAG: leucine--tRNA ligase [Chloroflexota bacterium]